MSVVLLRTLTAKSIIGFGAYKDISVQNLLDMYNHKELLQIYYNFRNIDFCKELKEQLCIYGEREINKKDKSIERFVHTHFISLCLRDIIDRNNEEENKKAFGYLRKENYRTKKNTNRQVNALTKIFHNKSANRNNNQWNPKN